MSQSINIVLGKMEYGMSAPSTQWAGLKHLILTQISNMGKAINYTTQVNITCWNPNKTWRGHGMQPPHLPHEAID